MISVLMSVYNGEMYLYEAIESILNQTYGDFEFIIYNDASTDKTVEIIESFKDPRIILINNESNLGLTKNLNKGICIAKGEYIARMDADDVSHSERFAKQFFFLENNPHISICGTQINELGKLYQKSNFPLTHNEIKIELLSSNPLAHPTVIWRKSHFDENDFKYNEAYKTSQDYELWARALYKLKAANLNENLLQYRVHDRRLSVKQSNDQNDNAIAIKIAQLGFLNIYPTVEEIGFHLCMFNNEFYVNRDASTIKKVDAWMYKLYLKNRALKIFDNVIFIKTWRGRFFGKGLYQYNMSIWLVLKHSYCRKYCKVSAGRYYKQLVKCLFKWNIKRATPL